jgi:sugar lactone lactonase YvrE
VKRLAGGFGLLEGARWYPDLGLVFSDMTGGGVFHLGDDPGGSATPKTIIPYRKGIGGLVRHGRGGFVVSGRNVAVKPVYGDTQVLLETGEDEQFFNDLTADGLGRIYVGSVGGNPLDQESGGGTPRHLGRLYRIDLDGSAKVLSEDVIVSNGLAVDPSQSDLYHVDTGRKLVWRYDVRDGSEFGWRQPFVDTSEYQGEPDGLALAADGSVWVAMAGGGVVIGWDSKARRILEVPVPQSLVTSVCFGGPAYATLFVLTGHTGPGHDEDGGSVYEADVGVRGMPAPVASVR